MRKLYDAADRFCARHPRFGVPDLMRYIVIGNVVVFFLIMLTRGTNANALNFLYFDPQMVLRGEVWRIVTYIFVPSTTSVFWLVVELYFYYWIGSTLEREWGTARFNLYYWSGVLLTVIGALLASAITGGNFAVAGTSYVNLSMFLAFALLFPNTQVLLMFIIPVKMKWLAYIDVGLFAAGHFGAELGRRDFADHGAAELPDLRMAHPAGLGAAAAVSALPTGGELQEGRPSAAEAAGVSPQVCRVRPHGYGLSGPAVPVLQQVRGLSLLLSGSYLLPRSLYGVRKTEETEHRSIRIGALFLPFCTLYVSSSSRWRP